MPKFKLGDKFIRKGSKDSFPMIGVEIDWREHDEPMYKLKQILLKQLKTKPYEISEETLEEMYKKIE